jgi:hypothetical protein
MKYRDDQIAELKEDINRTLKKNEETIKSIEKDTNFEKEDIEKKNQYNQS